MGETLKFIFGFFGSSTLMFVVFFVFVLPRVMKMQKERKRQAQEERLRKEQNKIQVEKEKFELELMKQKMALNAELEAKKTQPTFCQYCGAKIIEESVKCPLCGARLDN